MSHPVLEARSRAATAHAATKPDHLAELDGLGALSGLTFRYVTLILIAAGDQRQTLTHPQVPIELQTYSSTH